MRTRIVVLKGCLLALFVAVGVRLAQVQIVDAREYREVAKKQYEAKITLPAVRGALFDRNGSVIASNSMFVSFAADPKIAAEDALTTAQAFAEVFGKPVKFYMKKLEADSRFVWLERQVHIDYLKKLHPSKMPGVVVRYEPKRLYHYDQLAGQLIGFTDLDDKGTSGIELQFDEEMQGNDGYVVFQRDGKGRARPVVDYPRLEPRNGAAVFLTIDFGMQAIAEEELARGVERFKAESGIAVLLDPRTGEILAMAQNPPINLNKISGTEEKDQKLRAITDEFEPGSVFKVVTASAAIEHHLVDPAREFFAERGLYRVAIGRYVRKIVDVHPYEMLTLQGAMVHSSNIVMAKVSDIIGNERFYKMARDYGFGIATNIELPGEVKGTLKKPIDWSATTLNTMAFGYEVGTTPLQTAMAYAAVANGGILMKPYILRRVVDASGTVVLESAPQKIRRVISPATAQVLKEYFIGVVDSGTAKAAAIPGVTIAGKTGTAKKFVGGRYEKGKYTATFVGFFPAGDPRLVCLVMVDNPSGGSYTGGATSAPIFQGIARRIMNTSEWFAPSSPSKPIFTSVEPSDTDALAGSAPPAPANNVPARKAVYGAKESSGRALAGSAGSDSLAGPLVPDVTGLTVRRAVGLLNVEKFEPMVSGSGIVVSQEPAAGTPARAGMKVALVCQPRPFVTAAGK